MSEKTDPAPPQAAGEDILTDHAYDGIQEYDNPTPRWWELLFVLSIVFAPIYALWFHAPTEGRTLAAAYEKDLADNLSLQFGDLRLQPDEQTILAYMNHELAKVGAATFATNCVSCHGREAEGISGPNLTDDSYKNVKQIADIAKVIQNGAANGAMPAWGNRLTTNEIVVVSSYVASLRGENRPGRPAEGNVIEPWPAAPPSPQPESPEPEAPQG